MTRNLKRLWKNALIALSGAAIAFFWLVLFICVFSLTSCIVKPPSRPLSDGKWLAKLRHDNPHWQGVYRFVFDDAQNIIGLDFTPQEETIPPLADTKYLALVDRNSHLEDLSALKRYRLEVLIVPRGEVKKLPVRLVRQLRRLVINDNPLQKMPRADYAHLESLDISGTRIDNIAFLKSAVRLQELNLAGNAEIQDIRPLKNKAGLRKIDIRGTAVDSLAALSGLPLEEVAFSLQALHSLDFLDTSRIRQLEISDYPHDGRHGPNKTMRLRNRLNCRGTFPELECLRLKSLDIDSLDFLTRSPKLRELDFSTVVLPDGWQHKICLDNLEVVRLRGLWGGNIDFLQHSRLKELELHFTDIVRLPAIDSLVKLDISHSLISAFPVCYPNLEEMNISDTPIDAIPDECPNSLECLKILDMSWTDVDGIGPILAIPHLESLRMDDVTTTTFLPELNVQESLEVLTLDRICLKGEQQLVCLSYYADNYPPGSSRPLPRDNSAIGKIVIPENSRLHALGLAGRSIPIQGLDSAAIDCLDISGNGCVSAIPSRENGYMWLNISNTLISDISPLVGASTQAFIARNCKIESFAPLSNANLRLLDLSYSNFNEDDFAFIKRESLPAAGLKLDGTSISLTSKISAFIRSLFQN